MNSRFVLILFSGLMCVSAIADDRVIEIYGAVQDAVSKFELTTAYIIHIDADGNPQDTLHVSAIHLYNVRAVMSKSDTFVYFAVPTDSTYVFEVGCEGYQPQTVVYRVANLGKREFRREMPIIYLDRAPRKLSEVTVTVSKIKFYNKGDTIVYNTDAFLLAEGSMLDGLISQLLGVELNSQGQIRVNGEFVESLLLNGRFSYEITKKISHLVLY